MVNQKWEIVVTVDGRTLKAIGNGTEEGTLFEGDAHDIATTKAAIRHKVSVSLGAERRSPESVAGYESPLALTAALFCPAGPYTTLEKAPKEVWEVINEYEKSSGSEIFTLSLEGRTSAQGKATGKERLLTSRPAIMRILVKSGLLRLVSFGLQGSRRRVDKNRAGFTVTVEVDHGRAILQAISDGTGTEEGTEIIGSDEHIRRVKKSIRLHQLVDIVGTPGSPAIKSGYENPLALTAALYSISPLYTNIVEAPDEVLDLFHRYPPKNCFPSKRRKWFI